MRSSGNNPGRAPPRAQRRPPMTAPQGARPPPSLELSGTLAQPPRPHANRCSLLLWQVARRSPPSQRQPRLTGFPGLSTTSRRSERCAAAARTLALSPSHRTARAPRHRSHGCVCALPPAQSSARATQRPGTVPPGPRQHGAAGRAVAADVAAARVATFRRLAWGVLRLQTSHSHACGMKNERWCFLRCVWAALEGLQSRKTCVWTWAHVARMN